MEEVMGGLVKQLLTSFWAFTRFGRKLAASNSTIFSPLNLPSRS
jgi:hypothetical protein